MSWTKATTLDRLEQGPVLFKHPPKQLALFKKGSNIFAVDNRCPHEGYPLVEGRLDEQCILTCNWHNWQFQLPTGECILGGDRLRSYPVRIEEQDVWVDLTDPPMEVIEAGILKGLRTAFEDRDYGRICREIHRLRRTTGKPFKAVEKALNWSYDKLEFGTTHAYAATADWLTLRDMHGDQADCQLVCLAEAVDHMADDALRHPVYPYADDNIDYTPSAFLDAVENRQLSLAESMVHQAWQQGIRWQALEETFSRAALKHLNDFGHSLIYTLKTGQLQEYLEEDGGYSLIMALTRHLCYTTREDLLPDFRTYENTLKQLTSLIPGTSTDPLPTLPYNLSIRKTCQWLVEHFPRYSISTLYQALLETLARNLLTFDEHDGRRFDNSVTDNVGWLDTTHGITFANAVHQQCNKFPELWPAGLLQMACFAGRNRRYLDTTMDTHPWLVDNADAFFYRTHQQLFDHGIGMPIFSAHLVKTTLAVKQEIRGVSESCRRPLLAALNRFLQSTIKQKHSRRLARQAMDLVDRDYP